MGIPDQPAELPKPGGDGGLPPVTFGGGGHQTFKGVVDDNLYPGTCVKIEPCVGNFEGKETPQYVLLFTLDGMESRGEIAVYVSRKLSTHPKAKLLPLLKALKLRVPTHEDPNMPNPVGAKGKLLLEKQESDQGGRMKCIKVMPA